VTKRPKISKKVDVQKKRPVAKAKARKKMPKPRAVQDHGWILAGFDVSLSSMTGAAISYDAIFNKLRGPVFVSKRWQGDDHYFDRLKDAAMAHELVLELQSQLHVNMRTDEVYIAQEEPFPPHGKFMSGGASGALKQQAEISGAFLGSLLRWGYRELWQMGNMQWRKVVADMITETTGEPVTTHYTKWNSPTLAQRFNCPPKVSGKFRAKQWALDVMAPYFGQMYDGDEMPDYPDLIRRTGGHIPRPEDSKAKAFQPDDRYDALAVMWTLYIDMRERGQLSGLT
jgi:hypothetical protein